MAPALTSTPHPRIVLGTASFGNAAAAQAKFTSVEAATQLLQIFRDHGHVELDTARAYPVGAGGTSEQLLGDTRVGEWAVVSTKVTSFVPGSHGKTSIAKSIDGSLQALEMDKVSHSLVGDHNCVNVVYFCRPSTPGMVSKKLIGTGEHRILALT